MADSTLDPDYLTSGPDRSLGRGHGTDALGPSDISDTGSDMQGPGLSRDVGLDMEMGTTSDPDTSMAGGTAGPDVGDANLDSDSDSGGTGERAAASRDSIEADGNDIDTDQVEDVEAVDPGDADVDAGRERAVPAAGGEKRKKPTSIGRGLFCLLTFRQWIFLYEACAFCLNLVKPPTTKKARVTLRPRANPFHYRKEETCAS